MSLNNETQQGPEWTLGVTACVGVGLAVLMTISYR